MDKHHRTQRVFVFSKAFYDTINNDDEEIGRGGFPAVPSKGQWSSSCSFLQSNHTLPTPPSESDGCFYHSRTMNSSLPDLSSSVLLLNTEDVSTSSRHSSRMTSSGMCQNLPAAEHLSKKDHTVDKGTNKGEVFSGTRDFSKVLASYQESLRLQGTGKTPPAVLGILAAKRMNQTHFTMKRAHSSDSKLFLSQRKAKLKPKLKRKQKRKPRDGIVGSKSYYH